MPRLLNAQLEFRAETDQKRISAGYELHRFVYELSVRVSSDGR